MISTELWQLKFGVEVSGRYHEWRRDTMESNSRNTRAATFAGSIVTLATALSSSNPGAIASLAIIIAVANLWELIAGWPRAVCVHTEPHRRFAELQAKVLKVVEPDPLQIADWEAEAALIRRDEPPTMWAVYAMCWNQTIARHETQEKGYYRDILCWQHAFANLLHFTP
jgi:hypothetical protein